MQICGCFTSRSKARFWTWGRQLVQWADSQSSPHTIIPPPAIMSPWTQNFFGHNWPTKLAKKAKQEITNASEIYWILILDDGKHTL